MNGHWGPFTREWILLSHDCNNKLPYLYTKELKVPCKHYVLKNSGLLHRIDYEVKLGLIMKLW